VDLVLVAQAAPSVFHFCGHIGVSRTHMMVFSVVTFAWHLSVAYFFLVLYESSFVSASFSGYRCAASSCFFRTPLYRIGMFAIIIT